MTLHHEVIIPPEASGKRLDKVLAELFPDYSRSRLQSWIEAGQVSMNGKPCRSRDKIKGGESLIIDGLEIEQTKWVPENIELPIVYEDDDILVINKPIGMVVHPAVGNHTNTMANALLNYLPQLANVPRVGIIHRLDKDTSGLLVITKTSQSNMFLTAELQARKIHREYVAIVNGVLISGGTINEPIGRHPKFRQKRAVVTGGKASVTHYRVIERFKAHTLLKVILETGRTHQIRVHMAHRGNPLLGDKTYGARPIVPQGASPELLEAIRGYKHQALHAKCLSFSHPTTQKEMKFEAEMPEEMAKLVELLRKTL